MQVSGWAADVAPPWKVFQEFGYGRGPMVATDQRAPRRPAAPAPPPSAQAARGPAAGGRRGGGRAGVAGITHRAVTERAGLPLATASYFFSSIDDLVAEALRTFVADEAGACPRPSPISSPATRPRPDEMAAALAEAVDALGPLPWALAQFETYLQAARDDAMRAPVATRSPRTSTWPRRRCRRPALAEPRSARHRRSTPWPTASPCTTWPGPQAGDVAALRRALRLLFLGLLVERGERERARRWPPTSPGPDRPAARPELA